MHLDRAFDSTWRASRGEQGRLCVGVTSTTPFHPVVPRAIRAFREACPIVVLTLEECLSNESVDRVWNGQMDVAFIRATSGIGHGLAVTSLLDEPMVVALLSTHLLAKAKKRVTGFTRSTFPRDVSSCMDRPGRECTTRPSQHARLPASVRALAIWARPRNWRLASLRRSVWLAPALVSLVPLSLRRMNMEGVTSRPIMGANRPMVTLKLASRRDGKSAVVRKLKISSGRQQADRGDRFLSLTPLEPVEDESAMGQPRRSRRA